MPTESSLSDGSTLSAAESLPRAEPSGHSGPSAPTRPALPGRARRFHLWDRSAWREPALLLAVPAALVGHYYVTSDLSPWSYALDRAASAHDAIIGVAPFVATTAAWEMTTLRRLWGRLPVRRPWWQVLAGRLALPVAVALVIMLTAHVVMIVGMADPAFPGWQIPALSVAAVLGWALFGAAAGLVAGPVVALPVTLVTPVLVMGIPGGWPDPLWARHVTGLVYGCCSTGSVFDPRALRASLAFLGVLAVVCLCVAAVRLAPARPGPGRPLLAAAVAAVVAAAGLGLARDVRELGHSSGIPRPTADMECHPGDVCLWPEDRAFLDINVQAWAKVRAAWAELGLPPTPPTLGPRRSDTPLPIAVTAPTVEQAQASLAMGLPVAMRGCLNRENQGTAEQQALFMDLIFLLSAQLEVPPPFPPSRPGLTAADAPAIWAATPTCHGRADTGHR